MKGLSLLPPFSTSKKNPTTAYESAFVASVCTKWTSRSMTSPSMLCSEGAWKWNWRGLYYGKALSLVTLSGKARYIPAPERVDESKKTFFSTSLESNWLSIPILKQPALIKPILLSDYIFHLRSIGDYSCPVPQTGNLEFQTLPQSSPRDLQSNKTLPSWYEGAGSLQAALAHDAMSAIMNVLFMVLFYLLKL